MKSGNLSYHKQKHDVGADFYKIRIQFREIRYEKNLFNFEEVFYLGLKTEYKDQKLKRRNKKNGFRKSYIITYINIISYNGKYKYI